MKLNDIKLYKEMVRIRMFEEEVERSMQAGYIHGTTHLCNGQEAVAVGVCSLLEAGDMITSTHRGHGHSLAFGADMKRMMAELYGKATGYCKGKGGSMHIADVSSGNLGANGIVGGGIPIAVGAALTAKMKKTNDISVCFFGDGATNEGSFHESLNLAAIWDVPVVFICENNEYGMSSPIDKMVKIEELSKRADAYGFRGVTIDGNNLEKVREEAKKAIARAREGEGPTLIEAKTYRFKGHSRSDKELYRTALEVNERQKDDPITRYKQHLLKKHKIEPSTWSNIEAEVKQEIKDAITFAKESKAPHLSTLLEDVYA